jgi:uncharacterized SAM-dependent methyltransferase
MTSAPIAVTVHPSQFPGVLDEQVRAGLRGGELPGKLHYLSWRQARAWLALHKRYAPYFSAADGVALYDRAAADAAAWMPCQPVTVISLGCGGGQKDAWLLEHLAPRPVRYIPVDAGLDLLLGASQSAIAALGPDAVRPQLMDLAAEDDWGCALAPVLDDKGPRLIVFYGMLAGMGPAVAGPRLRTLLGEFDLLLLSANLAPGPSLAQGAREALPHYDNPETRAWLGLALEDLGLDPEAGSWCFRVVEDSSLHGLSRIEAWFTPGHDAVVELGGETAEWKAGTSVRLLGSNRFSASLMEAFARAHGLAIIGCHISQAGDEGVFLATLAGSSLKPPRQAQ